MKKSLLLTVLMSALLAGVSFGATTFVCNYDNLGGATVSDRLTADFAVGSTTPVTIVQQTASTSVPDVLVGSGTAPSPTPKFGAGALRARTGTYDTALTYSMANNLNVDKGTLEVWVYGMYQSDNTRIFAAGNAGLTSGEFMQIYSHSTGTYKFQIKDHPGGVAKTISTPAGTHLSYYNSAHPGWQLLGIEWNMTTGASATNYIRMYLNGEKVDELYNIATFSTGDGASYIRNHTEFGIGTYSFASTSSFRGWIDSVRMTDEQMVNLYELDENGNYNVPLEAFVPEPATIGLFLIGMGLCNRRRG